MATDRVAKFLEDIRSLDAERFKLVQALREKVFAVASSIKEEAKYGGILFSVQKPFCGIFSYAKHVSLEFGECTSLPDKYKVLEGEGKLRRHIKLLSLQDISSKHVAEYLVLARKLGAKP